MMPTLTSGEPSFLETHSDPLYFRIRGGVRDGQIVAVEGNKIAVGAGPECGLRLRARGLSSVHCVLLRGAHELIARRWSADTRLNGRSFETSPLAAGDTLSIGPINLEVFPVPVQGGDGTTDESPSQYVDHTQAEQDKQIAELQAALTGQEEDRQRLASELECAQAMLAEAESQAERLSNEHAERMGQVEEQLRATLASLESALQERDRQAQEHEGDGRELTRLRFEAEELRSRIAELETNQRLASDDLKKAVEERNEFSARLSEQSQTAAQLEAERDELVYRLNELETEFQQRVFESSENRDRSANDPEAPAWRTTDYDAESTGVADEVRNPAGETDAASPDPFAHLESISQILRREESYQDSSYEDDSEASPEHSARTREEEPTLWSRSEGRADDETFEGGDTQSGADSAPTYDKATEDEDQSIQDYMTQLLRRNKGESSFSPDFASPKSKGESDPPPSTPPTSVPTTGAGGSDVPAPVSSPDKLVRRVPKHVHKESAEDLHTLREIADFSARQALKSSNFRRWKLIARENLGLAGIAAFTMLVVYLFSSGVAGGIAVGTAAVATIFLTGRAAWIYFRTRIPIPGNRGKNAKHQVVEHAAGESSPPGPRAVEAGPVEAALKLPSVRGSSHEAVKEG